MEISKNNEYVIFLNELKTKIYSSKVSVSKSVNKELILLYWNIGKEIKERQDKLGWDKSVVEMLAKDLKKEFASTEGFSTRNLWNMRAFYDEYKENQILQQLVAEIPWGHNLLIMNKVKNENPSIGIILCDGKDNFDVEYSLRGIHKPMGVSEYRLTKELPPELRDSLPSIEDIEMELSKDGKQ